MRKRCSKMTARKIIRYTCTWCGATVTRPQGVRPTPGNCPRKPKTKDGQMKPHTWAKA